MKIFGFKEKNILKRTLFHIIANPASRILALSSRFRVFVYKSKIEAKSQEFQVTIEEMEASKAEASASIREYQKRLEELALREDRREKALVVGTAAALAVGLLAYIVK